MKRQLERIYWRGILITLLMAGMALFLTAKTKIDDTADHLTALLHAASGWTLDSNEDLQSLAGSIAGISPSLRITFLLDSGIILADSISQTDPGTSHQNDPEILAARRGETGHVLRMSPGNASLMLYMAARVSPQLILRISSPVLPIARFLLFYGLALLVLILILNHLQRRAIGSFADRQSRQLEDIRRLLDGQISSAKARFPEYQPSMDAISYRIRRMQEDRDQIRRTLDLRTNFVANASHELRSPLTSVQGYAEMLGEGLADTPAEQELCIRMIRSGCRHMQEVISDILLLGKAERPRQNLPPGVPAFPVADEVLQALQIQASARDIRLLLENDGEPGFAASQQDLREIFFNLTDNAIRYGRPGGYVKIRLRPGQIRVEDNGIGIDADALPHIFEPFYRIDDSRDADAAGTGLGLSIVKAIVESFGAVIRAESVPGSGTCFIIEQGESYDA